MNKAELVNEIAKATGQTKLDVHNTVAAVLHHLTTSMAKGDRVTLVGFGTFERRQRQSRMGVNPQNPDQKLKIPAAKVPVFRAGQELKSVVNGKKKLPALAATVTAAKPAAKPKKAAKPKAAAKAKAKTASKAKPKKAAAKKTTAKAAKKTPAKQPAANKPAKKTAKRR
ncbi:MAG: HU family DNA-binding protein [Cyanobacteriota/Melainabacteria group bacterium]